MMMMLMPSQRFAVLRMAQQQVELIDPEQTICSIVYMIEHGNNNRRMTMHQDTTTIACIETIKEKVIAKQ
jgi:hypothetical protein